MSQKRFTRSSTLATRNNHKRQNKSKQQAELSEKVREAIADHKFNQALSLINSVPFENHWTTCQRAHVLFQMGRISRSLNAVRNALKIQRKNCTECLVLLLKIIDKRSPNFHPFLTDITNCLNTQGIPREIKAQYQNRKSQIIIKEQPHSESTKEDRQKFKDMTSYYQKKGLMFKKVQIVEIDEQYRVARAKSAIKPNQIIIFVPEKEMITLELAKSMTQINKLSQQQAKLKSPKHCMLSVFLLIHMELGQNSPYFNYIQCLPRKLHNFPIYYSDQLIEELKGTSFAILIRRKKSDLSEDFKQVTSILPQLKQVITYEKFVWARMIVSSRIFGVIINQKKTDALVPIADMLNHKIPKMTSWYFCDQRKGFIVRNAQQQIPKGYQIFDSYGYKCNSRFLLNYGFTIPQNAYNQVMIVLKKKRSVKISAPNIKLSTSINSDQFKIMLAYFRHCILQKSQNNGVEPNQIRKKVSSFLSNENQCETWKLVQQTIKQQLQQYKTTIKMDEKILRSSEVLSFNLRNCIQIRLGQKRVLDFYARMSKKMIQYFTRKRKKVEIKDYEAYLREIQKSLGHLGE